MTTIITNIITVGNGNYWVWNNNPNTDIVGFNSIQECQDYFTNLGYFVTLSTGINGGIVLAVRGQGIYNNTFWIVCRN